MAHAEGSSFPTTHWSELARLESPEFASAMASLCQRYWYPIYAFIRRRCGDTHRAEDLTQAFFAHVLAKQTFRAADPNKGRFRAFLLTSVRNFVANQLASQRTLRRGGDHQVVSIDFAIADRIYLRNRSSEMRPEEEFDRAWAMTLMEKAIERLHDEYASKGQADRFEHLSPLLRSAGLDYDAIASALQIDAAAARKAASRFRARYAQVLRDEISSTLSENGKVEEELAWIFEIFSR